MYFLFLLDLPLSRSLATWENCPRNISKITFTSCQRNMVSFIAYGRVLNHWKKGNNTQEKWHVFLSWAARWSSSIARKLLWTSLIKKEHFIVIGRHLLPWKCMLSQTWLLLWLICHIDRQQNGMGEVRGVHVIWEGIPSTPSHVEWVLQPGKMRGLPCPSSCWGEEACSEYYKYPRGIHGPFKSVRLLSLILIR